MKMFWQLGFSKLERLHFGISHFFPSGLGRKKNQQVFSVFWVVFLGNNVTKEEFQRPIFRGKKMRKIGGKNHFLESTEAKETAHCPRRGLKGLSCENKENMALN